MTALVLVFCLQAAPATCTEQRPLKEVSPQACLVWGQHYASEWLAEHPKWRLSGWRCEHKVPSQRPV